MNLSTKLGFNLKFTLNEILKYATQTNQIINMSWNKNKRSQSESFNYISEINLGSCTKLQLQVYQISNYNNQILKLKINLQNIN